MNRRGFIKSMGALVASVPLAGAIDLSMPKKLFKLGGEYHHWWRSSEERWSISLDLMAGVTNDQAHRALLQMAGTINSTDFFLIKGCALCTGGTMDPDGWFIDMFVRHPTYRATAANQYKSLYHEFDFNKYIDWSTNG